MSTFEELERLNAKIDIWIDEEKYDEVNKVLPHAKSVKSLVAACFEETGANRYCTQPKDPAWKDTLSHRTRLPIAKAYPNGRNGGEIPLNEGWSRLFYSKLLRARIKEKGTDCYSHRLDEVVAYLENHLPAVSDERTAKLAVLYLLELSAASLSFEMIGFAERAHRMMRERKDMFEGDGGDFCGFYELLAGYNLGIGYFHKGRYRKAIKEFNRIIEKVRETEKPDKKMQLDFFRDRHGYRLLYLPAVLYRADVQLKLQLAYHSLDTLINYFKPPEEISAYKEVRAEMVRAEAYRQMDMLEDKGSWKHITCAYNGLAALEEPTTNREGLAERTDFTVPGLLFKGERQGIKGRLLDIYVQDYLEWLEQLPQRQLDEQDGKWTKCSEMLRDLFLKQYFTAVRFHARSRNGYYQQLARFLEWLVSTDNNKQKFPEAAKVADELYKKRGKLMLERYKAGCPFCTVLGADFNRIMNPEHYSWLKDSMMKYFEDSQKLSNGNKEAELEKFVTRFIKQERESRDDLRIVDLNLRYKSERVKSKLKGGLELCRGSDSSEAHRLFPAFDGLLDGPGSDEESEKKRDSKKLGSKEYGQIMTHWDADFRHRLQSESNHKGHRSGLYIIGLQRWNSSSPAQGRSVGGGYLLYHTDNGTVDLGIAIDPGFDFVRNLFHMGFSINDIDIVLISHSHVDHVRDFESMIQLLTDLKDKSKVTKCLHVILSLGVYERLTHIIEDPFYRYHVEPYIIDARREIELGYFEELELGKPFRFAKLCKTDSRRQSGVMRYEAILLGPKDASPAKKDNARIKVTIQPTRAYHPDPSRYSDSFGFLVKVTERIKPPEGSDDAPSCHTMTLGYTGDTKWVYPCVPDPLKGERTERRIWDVSEQYVDCDAVIVHLGSLVDTDKEGLRKQFMDCLHCDKKQRDDCRDLVCKKDHPYLVGLLRMLSTLRSKAEKGNPQLVLVSEFGEELRGGIRTDFIKRLTHAYNDALSFLPVDVGMDVQLWPEARVESGARKPSTKQKVWCVQCERFVDIGDAQFERYGVDEALFCVCQTCRKATPLNVMQDRLRQLYEVGRELRTLDE